MLVFGKLKSSELKKLALLSMSTPVRVVQVVCKDKPQALEHVKDPNKHLRKACQVSSTGWALLRPDAYLAARGQRIDSRLIHAVGQALSVT